MTITHGKGNLFADQQLEIATMTYTKAGDTFGVTLNRAEFGSSIYARKHMILSGSFRADYPNTDYLPDTDYVGGVWPSINSSDIKYTDNFNIVALEDNSSHLCIRTYKLKQVQEEITPLKKSNSYTLLAKNVYVCSVPVKLNDTIHEIGTVFSPEEDKEIIALDNGNLVRFFAITVSDPDKLVTVISTTLTNV